MIRKTVKLLDVKWSKLNRLGKSKILKSSYYWIIITPILAKIFSKIESTLSLELFGTECRLVMALPFSIKIFYSAALIFALSSLLYSAFCPDVIKKYNTYTEFKKSGNGASQLVYYLSGIIRRGFLVKRLVRERMKRMMETIFDRCIEGKPTDMEYEMEEFLNNPEKYTYQMEHICIKNDHMDEAFWAVRNYSNRSYPLIRYTCVSLYIIGFILLTINIYENIMAVFRLSS